MFEDFLKKIFSKILFPPKNSIFKKKFCPPKKFPPGADLGAPPVRPRHRRDTPGTGPGLGIAPPAPAPARKTAGAGG